MRNLWKVSFFFLITFLALPTFAEGGKRVSRVGDRLGKLEIRDAKNQPIPLPGFGKRPILIFYADPDHPSCDFTDYLEEHPLTQQPKLLAYGIVNLKDAPLLPNAIVRAMVRAKIRKTGAAIYTDPDRLLSEGWNLGDCNNRFVFLIVDVDGTLLYFSKGEPTKKEIKEFYRVVNSL
ncbi:MAG: hypothetical protein ACOYJE_02680 [Bacteroidaceae bacterium]|jgi:hypothetical protein